MGTSTEIPASARAEPWASNQSEIRQQVKDEKEREVEEEEAEAVVAAGEDIFGKAGDDAAQAWIAAHPHQLIAPGDAGAKPALLDQLAQLDVLDYFHGQPSVGADGLVG